METKQKNEKKNKIEAIDLLIFLTIILIFGIVLLSFFPAILTSDSVDQMRQAETRSLFNNTFCFTFIYIRKYC